MQCTDCKREIKDGYTYCIMKSEVIIQGGETLDSITIIAHCMDCLSYPEIQMHPCLESLCITKLNTGSTDPNS